MMTLWSGLVWLGSDVRLSDTFALCWRDLVTARVDWEALLLLLLLLLLFIFLASGHLDD